MNVAAVNSATSDLTKIAATAQTVEAMAAQAPAPVTGAQKLQAALLIASQIPNPNVQATAGLISTMVEVWNLFGVFAHAPAQTPAPAAK